MHIKHQNPSANFEKCDNPKPLIHIGLDGEENPWSEISCLVKKVHVFHNVKCPLCTKNTKYLEDNDDIRYCISSPIFLLCFDGKQESCVDIHRENPRILYSSSHFSLSFRLLHNYTRKHLLVIEFTRIILKEIRSTLSVYSTLIKYLHISISYGMFSKNSRSRSFQTLTLCCYFLESL